MPKTGALVRFNADVKIKLIRDVRATVAKEDQRAFDEQMTSVKNDLVKLWVGEEHKDVTVPLHWLPYFDGIYLTFPVSGRHTGGQIFVHLHRHLPAYPEWENVTMKRLPQVVAAPPVLVPRLIELWELKQKIERSGDSVCSELTRVLAGQRFVRDVRVMFPELDEYLPPDRTTEGAASVSSALALTVDYGELREQLKRYGIGVGKKTEDVIEPEA